MRVAKKHSEEVKGGDMTTMIDMTFQLIAFFMVLISFSQIEQDQRITLPVSELAIPSDDSYDRPLTVQIFNDNTIKFGSQEMNQEGLRAKLLIERQFIDSIEDLSVTDVTIILRANASIKAGYSQEIIQLCKEFDFEHFVLRGKSPAVH